MSEPTISLKEVKNGSQASNDRLTTLSKSWYLKLRILVFRAVINPANLWRFLFYVPFPFSVAAVSAEPWHPEQVAAFPQ